MNNIKILIFVISLKTILIANLYSERNSLTIIAGAIMQDRGSSGNINVAAVEELDPLTINENDDTLRKIQALTAGHPGVHYFEASQRYDFMLNSKKHSVSLTKPLRLELECFSVDLNKVKSLSPEENKKFAIFLRHLKQYSIANKDRSDLQKDIVSCDVNHLFAFVDEGNTVVYRYVRLSHPLVVYPRRKDSTDRRFAVIGKEIASGSYGSTFFSATSLSCSQDNNPAVTVNNKKVAKQRVAKFQADKWSASCKAIIPDHEYNMTKILAPELAVKTLAKHTERKTSAMLMRRIPGDDLLDTIKDNKIKNELERLEICLAVAEALKVVHDRGGIHRDVKPDNVMLTRTEGGQISLQWIDFGLSILQSVKNNTASGSMIYLAPELLCEENATVASDVYSLCRLFEIVFGHYPSWINNNKIILVRNCFQNASKPYDDEIAKLDKSTCDLLKTLGWCDLLNGMRAVDPQKRTTLEVVIVKLKSIIAAFKAAHESRSIFSSAASAAATTSTGTTQSSPLPEDQSEDKVGQRSSDWRPCS